MPQDAIVALHPGASFQGRYRVVRALKAGGMGAVYEVVDERTDSPRALKIMLPSVLADPQLRARFTLEAKVTGNIASDHIVRVSDAGIDEATGTPFLVMELLRGRELGSLLSERGALPASEAALYLHQAALALDKTHAAGIVHRDLKPENLFVTYRDDGSPCVKILDFGIAKVVAEGTAQTTHAIGTPIYMAPEQIAGAPTIGPRADLFALGHIAFALLTGAPYWKEEQKASPSIFPLLTTMMAGMPESPVERARRRSGVALPPAFDAWMARAAAMRQEDRFDRATVQVAALVDALGVPTLGAMLPPPGPVPPPSVEPRVSAAMPLPASPGLGSVPHLTAGTQGAMVSNAAPSRPRAVWPAVLGAIALGAIGAWALFMARSHDTPAAAPSAAAAKAAATVAVSAAPAEPTAPSIASAAVSPSAPSASAAASAKAPPTGTSPPRRSTPPRPAEASTPAPSRITSPL